VWARSTAYWTWFRSVRWERASLGSRARHAGIDEAFAARVRAAAELCRSFESRGFDPRWPIRLKGGDRVLRSDTGKIVDTALVAGGGCHRLALLMLDGAEQLEPEQYFIEQHGELTALDNTFLLRSLFAGRPLEYLRFIAMGYMPHTPVDFLALADWVIARAPDRCASLATALRIDAIVSVPRTLATFLDAAGRR